MSCGQVPEGSDVSEEDYGDDDVDSLYDDASSVFSSLSGDDWDTASTEVCPFGVSRRSLIIRFALVLGTHPLLPVGVNGW